MRPAWNIVLKDFYRLRWILLLWLVIMVASMGLATIQAGLDKDTYYPFHIAAFLFASGLLPLIGFGLVMGLVHDDPVCDTDAFWITRPISNSQLLAAKTIGLVLICFLPVIVTVPWWVSHDYGLGQLSRAAQQVLRGQVIIALLAAPFALLSPNGSRFVLHVILAAAGLGLLALVYWLSGSRDDATLPGGLMLTRGLLLAVLWLVATVAIIAFQFYGRRTRRSLAVVGVAVVMGFAIAKWWPWELSFGSNSPVVAAHTPLDIGFKSAAVDGNKTANAASERVIGITYHVRGLENGAVALARSVTHRFQWPDDPGATFSSTSSPGELEHTASAVAMGSAIEPSFQAELRLPAQTHAARLLRDRPTYSAAVEGEIRRFEIVSEMPVENGRRSVQRGAMMKISNVFWDLDSSFMRVLEVSVGESAPIPAAGTSPLASSAKGSVPEFYFLINRSDGYSLLGQTTWVGERMDVATMRYSNSVVTFRPSALRPGRNSTSQVPVDFPTWAKHAVLVKVAAYAAGSFQQTTMVTRFEPAMAGAANANEAGVPGR